MPSEPKQDEKLSCLTNYVIFNIVHSFPTVCTNTFCKFQRLLTCGCCTERAACVCTAAAELIAVAETCPPVLDCPWEVWPSTVFPIIPTTYYTPLGTAQNVNKGPNWLIIICHFSPCDIFVTRAWGPIPAGNLVKLRAPGVGWPTTVGPGAGAMVLVPTAALTWACQIIMNHFDLQYAAFESFKWPTGPTGQQTYTYYLLEASDV